MPHHIFHIRAAQIRPIYSPATPIPNRNPGAQRTRSASVLDTDGYRIAIITFSSGGMRSSLSSTTWRASTARTCSALAAISSNTPCAECARPLPTKRDSTQPAGKCDAQCSWEGVAARLTIVVMLHAVLSCRADLLKGAATESTEPARLRSRACVCGWSVRRRSRIHACLRETSLAQCTRAHTCGACACACACACG